MPFSSASLPPLANRIICLTSREIDQYLKAHIGRRDQYIYIYNGIDIEAFSRPPNGKQNLRQNLNIPTDAILCTTVGRLVPVKGQADLLYAFAQAQKTERLLHLLLVGEGELRAELEDLTKQLGIQNHVHFVGWRDDVADLLGISDIFVLPSHNEGLSLVIVEAMARSLPVIATEVGGVPEVVVPNQTGVLTPARNPKSLAGALICLASNAAQRTQMGQAGYHRAVSYFSIDATARHTGNLYTELTGVSA